MSLRAKSLERRVSLLETSVPKLAPVAQAQTDYIALRESLRLAPNRQQPSCPPTGCAGVRRLKQQVVALERLSRMVPPPDVPGRTNFERLKIELLPRSLPDVRWQLRHAELAVLAEAGFDARSVARWQVEHEQSTKDQDNLRATELPADARAVIDQFLADSPENAERDQDEAKDAG